MNRPAFHWRAPPDWIWRVLILLLAVGVLVLITTRWTRWESNSRRQSTDDAYLQSDLTPISAKVAGYVRSAKATAVAALASFDSVVLQALKETEQALATYGSELDRRQALSEAQDRAHQAFDMAHDQFLAGSLSNLDLLTTEQSLVAADAAVASSDAALIQDQIAVFRALGGGWRGTEVASR
jgi:multidrug resistance efflux pump